MRILWLFGPPGVGKSVTAWELLNVLSDRNEPTAYLDIDQLGMAAPEPRDDGEAHRRKTWALAAVSREHARRGASTLVVSGVLDPDQIEFTRDALADFDLALVRLTVHEVELRRRMRARGRYAEHWSGVLADARRHEAAGHGLTPLTTIRLTAATSELTARAAARARGEMAPLAGDDIVGATNEDLQLILYNARLAHESWSPASDALLDTTSLTAADAARRSVELTTT